MILTFCNERFFSIFNINFIFCARELIKEGNNKKVTKNETIKPKVIIHPKSIIGFIPLKTKDKNAQMVVSTV